MADDKYSSNLDSGDLAKYPSAATPLSIDELMAIRDVPVPAYSQGYPRAETAGQGTPPPAGASAPAAAAPIPATASPTTAQDYSMAGLAGLQREMGAAAGAENEIPTDNPKLDALNQKAAAKSAPTPLRTMTPEDTAAGRSEGTGAMLAQYKPTVMQRIGRGVRSGAVGYLTGGIPGGLVGAIEPQDIRGGTAYGAPNASYGREEAERKQELGDTQAQAAVAKEAWKARVDATAAKAKQIDASGKLAGDLTTGANANVKNANEFVDAAARNANETPEAKAKAKSLEMLANFDAWNTQANRLGLTGQNATFFRANGKLFDPRQATAEEIARSQALSVWRQNNPGQKLTMEALEQINTTAAGRPDKGSGAPIPPALANKILDEKKSAMDAATTLLRDRRDKAGGRYTQQNWLADMQEAQDKYESALEEAGGTANHMTIQPDGSWKPDTAAPAPAAPNAAAKPQPAPDGTHRQAPDGTVEVKTNGKWVKA
jgi:hypothetical protein